MDVSNSSLTTYQTCQKKWQWSYVEKLKPRKKSGALTLGTIIHKAFDMYYKPTSTKDIVSYIDSAYKEELSKVGIEDQEDIYLDSKTALGMFLNFPFDQMKFDEIQSEEEFRVEIAPGIFYIGKVDGKVKRTGKWWIREIKTTSEPKNIFEKRAACSSQGTGYIFGIRQQDGVDIQGVIYDYMRKPKLYKRKDECMEEFGQRIYMDYCDAKKKKSYFDRYPTYRSPFNIKEWLEDAIRTTHQIEQSIQKSDFPRNTNSCYSYNTECPFFKVCFAEQIDPLIVDLFYIRGGGANGREANSVETGSGVGPDENGSGE
jgi:hypothetical protein